MHPDDKQLSEAAGKAVIIEASSKLGIAELHTALSANAAKHGVAQIFDPGRVISRTHIAGAYLNALYALSERRNIAKNAATEMLLFAAMTRKISDAIELVGAKKSSDFILFCSDRNMLKEVSDLISSSKEFRPGKSSSGLASRALDVENDDVAVLQKMALSRL
ncbi:hypothetical protein M1329_02150 [Candidatus Marsarchaeota archaeon]|jgi:tRNA threonylcarbamoyladenosine modification (KEOPS) complex Cgi121 subunit|nr:hypothetical protein [Candidatus Marsarchaeota archaeon]MCL5100077.1 hypothetical protein [Candidatus Marsarchaeota archaeon]